MRALLLVLIISLGTIFPLFHHGFFPMHDDTQVVRVYEMHKALSEGQFPVRWVSDLGYGYGYPIFNFYAPLPYYVGGFLNFIVDSLTATKLMFIIGIILSGIFMYLLAKEIWGKWNGILAATLYLYAPYHALDIYVRGAVGEFWAIAFFALAGWGIVKLANEDRNLKSGFILTVLGLSGIILSHNILGMLSIIFLLSLLFIWTVKRLICREKVAESRYIFLAILFSLLLTAFFWLPALVEKDLTKVNSLTVGGSDFHQHFIYLDQLWDSPWGYAGSAGRQSGMSFKIGKLNIFLLGISLLGMIWALVKKKKMPGIIYPAFLILGLSLFMTVSGSKNIWESASFLAFIQYPWRFLSFVIFGIALIAPLPIYLLSPNRITKVCLVAIIFLTILPNRKYFQPQYYNNLRNNDYLSEKNIKWQTSKISDEYLPLNFPTPKLYQDVAFAKIVPSSTVNIKENIVKSTLYSYDLDVREKQKLIINLADFPAWTTYLNNQKINHKTQDGKIAVEIPKGNIRLDIKFQNTPIRAWSNLISLLSWLCFIIMIIKSRKKREIF